MNSLKFIVFAGAAVACFAGSPASLGAQSRVLSEAEAVSLALAADASTAVQRMDQAAKDRKAETRNNVFLPSLSVIGIGRENFSESGGSLAGVGTGIARLSSSLSLSASAIQAGRTAELDAAASRIQTRAAVEKVEKETRKAYYKLVLLREQKTAAEASVDVARGSFERAVEEYRNGLASERTRRQAEIAYETEKLSLARRAAEYAAAQSSFSARIGLGDGAWTVGGSLDFKPVDLGGIAAGAGAAAARADVALAYASAATQKSKVEETRKTRIVPTLSVSGQFDLTKTGAADPASSGILTLTLSSPNLSAFLPFSSDSVTLETGRLTLEKLRRQADQAAADAVLETEALLRSLSVSAAAVASLGAAVELAEEVVSLTREAYDVGGASYQDLRTAEKDAEAARTSLLSERYTYIAALIDLEYATGKTFRYAKESQ